MESNRFSKFVPERLIEAREARGITMMELAEKVGVTHQAISKYEKGKASPSFDTLEKISSALALPAIYFYKPYTKTSDHVVFFRSRAAATVKSKKVHESKIKWVKEIHSFLEQILEFPAIDVPKKITSDTFMPTDYRIIEEMADELRKHWGIGTGPISNVVLLLEKKGVIVSRAPFSSFEIDACSDWESKTPFILLSNDKTAVRSRFDSSHELGHFVLHSNIKASDFNNKENYKRIETEAHRFAAAFLLPAASFSKEFYSTSIDHLISLKRRWKISIQAIAYRAKTLGLISEYQYIYLRKTLANNNWLRNEPLDDGEIPFEEPEAFKQAMELIVKHNVKTRQDIVSEIALPREEIEVISGLDPGFLIEKNTKQNSNVISFKFK